ncbi:MAG: CoA-binding protein [Deltaproteobacteria bacterium]|nr:CoA-binding protein [Deltaproteobacteria bacterium]
MNLRRMLQPGSMAVYGVSSKNPSHPANIIYHKNHLRLQARTYAVNPRGGTLFGEPLFPSLAQLPEVPDVVVIALRAELVPRALEECASVGAGGAIVISGGFSEVGRTDLEDEVRRIAAANDLPVLGPNGLGVSAPPVMDTFFLPQERLIETRAGRVSIVSQSGGILVDLMIKLTQEGVGLARAISIGNKAVLDEVDLIAWLADDPSTDVVGVYLEGFRPGRGRAFVELVERIQTPVVVMKSGRTAGGARAVSSHTASVAGDYAVFQQVVGASKAVEAKDEAEFVAFCEVLARSHHAGVRRVGIVSASGGHGALASDGLYAAGVELPALSEALQGRIHAVLGRSVQDIASVANPVDLTGSATDEDFYEATRVLLDSDEVDAVMVLLLPYLPALTPHVGSRIAQVAQQHDKPVVTYIPHVDKYGIFIEGFEAHGVPVAHTVGGAVDMIRALARSR